MPERDEPSQPAPYPAHWEADIVAADGGTMHLRPITPEDADPIVAFHDRLSSRTRYLRYFSAHPRISEKEFYGYTHVDHHDRVAFVALLGENIVAVGLYEREPGTDEAEVAFVVADEHQGRGIGSVLLEHLAAAAQESGLSRFVAVVLIENQTMLRVFRDAGYEVRRSFDAGEVHLEFDVRSTPLTESVMREREQRADARSIARLLYPTSVAVVGASSDEGKVGNAVFRNLLRAGLHGTLYPVNPDAHHVHGVRAYPSVLEVPDPIELAVIAVPSSVVLDVVEQCGHKGVRGLVIVSGGFGERGDSAERAAGRMAQRHLVETARAHGMRVVGPELPRPGQHRSSGPTERHPRAPIPHSRAGGLLLPVRSVGRCRARRGCAPRARGIDVRVSGEPLRCLRQRPDAVLADGRCDGSRPAVPREFRQSAQVRPRSSTARSSKAHRGGEEWPRFDRCRAAAHVSRRARGKRPSPVRGVRRHPGRHARRVVRRRGAARVATAATG